MLRLLSSTKSPSFSFASPSSCSCYSCHLSSFSPKRMEGYNTPDAQPSRRVSSSSGRGLMAGTPSSSICPRSKSPENVRSQLSRTSPKKKIFNSGRSLNGDSELNPFDICKTPSSSVIRLRRSLLEINREKRNAKCFKGALQSEVLRPGMVLLKGFISHQDQVKIVKKCQELGKGEGGFYRPGYSDGAKLRLHMMCLGKNWDPEFKYDDKRRTDGADPPEIPYEFKNFVDEAIQVSHDVIRKKDSVVKLEEELPKMSPDICIINFYNNEGRLGLHQDRDESAESINRGLPVVSFSIGDSAEFLYGEGRDENLAQKVLLETGDVLVFGGKSSMIFHGVPKIIQNTAPKCLIDESNLRPGRLNLTFRQY